MSVEKIGPSRRPAFLGFLNERHNEFVELVLKAMIGVKRDINRVMLGGPMHMLGDGDCAECHVFQRFAGSKTAAAGGDLNDTVSPAFDQAAENGVGRSK